MAWDRNQGPKNNGRNPDFGPLKKPRTRSSSSDSAYQPDFFFVPLATGPLPLGEAIRQLPLQYKRVLTKPWTGTFLAEMDKAEWGIVWVQLLGYAIVAGLLGFLGTLIQSTHANVVTSSGGLNPTVLRALTLSTTFGLILFIPLLFFLAEGILRLLTRAFGGQGEFVQQCYTTLLFLVPFGLAVSIAGVIPFLGSFLGAFLSVTLFIYGIWLQTFATMAVHDLSAGKATAVVVITVLILIPLVVLSLSLWTFVLFAIFA